MLCEIGYFRKLHFLKGLVTHEQFSKACKFWIESCGLIRIQISRLDQIIPIVSVILALNLSYE